MGVADIGVSPDDKLLGGFRCLIPVETALLVHLDCVVSSPSHRCYMVLPISSIYIMIIIMNNTLFDVSFTIVDTYRYTLT